MEGAQELKNSPDIKAEELLSVIDSLENGWHETFSYNGSDYLIIPLKEDEVEGDEKKEDAWFHASTEINGWDIYILGTLPKDIWRRKMFHEVLECNLISQGHAEGAHGLALREEEKIFGPRKVGSVEQ